MRRKSFILALVAVVLLLAGVGTALVVMARHEPAYYQRGSIAGGAERRRLSKDFLAEFYQLWNAVQGEDQPSWAAQFMTEQINAFFQEDFLLSRMDDKFLPDNVSKPRVAIDGDRLRVGFRYGSGGWSTIITIDMRLWVAKGEINTVGLELLGLHAGALPINTQSLLEHVSEVARRNNIEVSWYRHERHPVALLRFGADQPRVSLQLQRVELQSGKMIIQGRCIDPTKRTTTETVSASE